MITDYSVIISITLSLTVDFQNQNRTKDIYLIWRFGIFVEKCFIFGTDFAFIDLFKVKQVRYVSWLNQLPGGKIFLTDFDLRNQSFEISLYLLRVRNSLLKIQMLRLTLGKSKRKFRKHESDWEQTRHREREQKFQKYSSTCCRMDYFGIIIGFGSELRNIQLDKCMLCPDLVICHSFSYDKIWNLLN